MASEKIPDLLSALLHATEDSRASWTPGSREDTFVYSGSSASVVLSTQDNDGLVPYVIRLLDAEGRTVEELTVGTSGELASVTYNLYKAARSDALNIDRTISGLLDDLGAADPF